MPYQKNGIRQYQREDAWDKRHKDPNGLSRTDARDARHKARATAIKTGMIKKGSPLQIDHKVPLGMGGSTKTSNLRAVSAKSNESFLRNKHGAIVSQISKKERMKTN